VFSTITSPVFSELVIVLTERCSFHFLRDPSLFETLRMMNEALPFKLVFLLKTSEVSRGKARRELVEALESVTVNCFLDFLESPPTVRCE